MVFKKIIRNLLAQVILVITCIPMSISAQVELPGAVGRSGVMKLDYSGASTAQEEFASIVQHYSFIAHNLIERSVKNKADNAELSVKKAALVRQVEDTFQPMVDAVRKEFFAGSQESKERAVRKFTNYILALCRKFGLRKYYLISLPVEVDQNMTLDQQVVLLKQGVSLLEVLYVGIRPLSPLSIRVKNKLFYNFFSTKVLPKFILGAGVITSYVWSCKNVIQYRNDITKHPHKDGVLYNYQRINHDDEIERTRGWLERKLHGAFEDTPLGGRQRGGDMDNVMSAVGGLMAGASFGNHGTGRHDDPAVREDEARRRRMFRPCCNSQDGHVCNDRTNRNRNK